MNNEITWSRQEISEYYKKALACKATHIVVTWDEAQQRQELHYVVPPKSVENVISELENQAYNIVRIVTMKMTLDATIKLNYLCLGERQKRNWKHRLFRYVECQECGAEVFREPVYSYVVGRPFIKCSSCGNFVQNEKRQEWAWMSAGEKLRALGAGLILTITHTVGAALLLGLLPIILNLFISFYAEPWIQGMMVVGGTVAFIATIYCRFGVILPSLKRTRDKKYWESYRNHIMGFTKIREEEKPKKENR
ncbi:MAG: hypothetical protein PHE26_13270 [Syntrophomonadaceae bacterium]|nr:hypothetical protein [Syntrophomonadaceae bacterium]